MLIMDKNFIEEELYKKIIEKTTIATVDVVVFSKDLKKVILFKRENEPAKGIYYTPGGRIFKEEEAGECALRKLKEELGIDAKESELVFGGAIIERFRNCFFSQKMASSFMNMFFSYTLKDENELKLDSQHAEYKWFSVDDETIFNYIKQKINGCLNNIKKDS